MLDGAGVLDEHPALAERWDELNEGLDEAGSIEELVEQIEADPDGIWLALQGLVAVEPEVRPEIVAGLARVPLGPGLVEFLRLLAYCHDEPTRAAALDALSADPGRGPPFGARGSTSPHTTRRRRSSRNRDDGLTSTSAANSPPRRGRPPCCSARSSRRSTDAGGGGSS